MEPSTAGKTLDYANASLRSRPRMTPFVIAAMLLIVVGMILADAGNVGKGDYNWRAAVGIACVFGGIAVYFVGRWLRRRPSAGAR